jgi:hypothetical protein
MRSPATRAILEAVCRAVVPPALDDVAPSSAELAAFVARYVERLPPSSAYGLVASLWLLELLSALSTGRRLSRLPRARRAAVLQAWAESRLGSRRLVARVATGFALLALYAAPSVRRKLELPC